MRLSKIKLSGFKSFVDPTTVAFPGNLMAIVGPNGCGKSNIIDAVRWVFGESSAKTLRGDSMADVIFNGSSVRKPVGRASVELTFSNADGVLSGPYARYSEVAVRRVVSRDGISKYYLNNSRCRRKDITHMLLGTGLGARGYSIIEQGTISRLVEAKPEELRAFLEEAAGISKYKERRRETESRIRRTRENLERLADLREEVAKQLDHLQRQARAAVRYKSLKADQRRMAAELLAVRLAALGDDFEARRIHSQEKQTVLDAALARQRATEARIEELRLELHERNDRHGEVQSQALEVDSLISRLEQSLEHREKLRQKCREDLEDIAEQSARIKAHIDSDRAEIRQIDQLLDELRPDLESAREVHQSCVDDLRRAEQAWEECQEHWGCVVEALADAERAEQVQVERLAHVRAEQQRLGQERDTLIDELSSSAVDRLGNRLDEMACDEKALKSACDDDSTALKKQWQKLQSLRGRESRRALDLDRERRRLHEQRGRLASLEALQEAAAEPTSSEVGDWLKSRDWHSNPRFADELAVEPGWEVAVETVLGAYMQAVCVNDIGEAAAQLDELTTGCLTLWGSGAGDDPAPDRNRRMLCRFVKGTGVNELLRGVCAAATLTEALAMRRRLKPGESVVTRDGLWMGPRWVRVGRGSDPSAGVLARAEAVKGLCVELAAGTERVGQCERALDEVRKDLERLEATRAQTQSDAAGRQRQYADIRGELDAGRTRLDELAVRVQAAQQRSDEIAAILGQMKARVAESETELEAAQQRREDLACSRADWESLREDQRRELDEVRAADEQGRARVQGMSMRIESEKASRESALGALDRVCAQQEHLRRRRGELQSEIHSATEPMAEDRLTLEEQLKKKLDMQNRLRAARRAVEDVESRLGDAKLLQGEREQRVESARESLEEARLEVRAVEVRMESVSGELSKSGFDTNDLLESLPEDASVPLWEAGLEKLARRIARLGSVNLAAIDELERQAERRRYLDAQFADLGKALETLEKAIRKIDRKTRTLFDATFKAANDGLARLFPRLYGGGHAYLELDGDDLLSSGVTIMARPPGKRVSTIHLLSGGEKALTAVALVFSIFELNPAPFCLLDEVDAPLDDANVGRFAEIVSGMSRRVQFVLVTHNKTTMESMQQLTGVTMSEPGVSRLVAVDIDEAVQLAAV